MCLYEFDIVKLTATDAPARVLGSVPAANSRRLGMYKIIHGTW